MHYKILELPAGCLQDSLSKEILIFLQIQKSQLIESLSCIIATFIYIQQHSYISPIHTIQFHSPKNINFRWSANWCMIYFLFGALGNSSSVFSSSWPTQMQTKKLLFTSVWEKEKLCFFSISSYNWWCVVTSTISKWRDFEIFCRVHVFLIFYATFDRCSKGVWTQVLNHYFRFWHIRFQWLSKFNFFEHFLVITKKDQVLFRKWRAIWIMNCFCTFFGTFEANC